MKSKENIVNMHVISIYYANNQKDICYESINLDNFVKSH